MADEDAGSIANSVTEEGAKKKAGKRTIARPYPLLTLARALNVATIIKEKNAGNPWPPSEVSRALGLGAKSSNLDFLTRSSVLYGLTSGTRASAHISLEKLGRDIVYAPNPQAELIARRKAFLNVELFSKVLEYYKGNQLPEIEFLSNTLISEFGLPREFQEEFRSIFLENCDYTSIGSTWIGLEKTPTAALSSSFTDTKLPAVRAFSASDNRDGKRCFVIMPFSERLSDRPEGFFEEVFDSLIKPAAESAGFDVATANRNGSDVIQSTIINELMDSDLVVADLTDHNPNVLFELGVRMAQ